MYATLFDDPDEMNRQLERYMAVTPEDVRPACAEFLVPDNRVVLTYVPADASTGNHGGRMNATIRWKSRWAFARFQARRGRSRSRPRSGVISRAASRS